MLRNLFNALIKRGLPIVRGSSSNKETKRKIKIKSITNDATNRFSDLRYCCEVTVFDL